MHVGLGFAAGLTGLLFSGICPLTVDGFADSAFVNGMAPPADPGALRAFPDIRLKVIGRTGLEGTLTGGVVSSTRIIEGIKYV